VADLGYAYALRGRASDEICRCGRLFFSLPGCNPRLNYVSVLLSLAINHPSREAEKQTLAAAGVIILHGGQDVTVPLRSTSNSRLCEGGLARESIPRLKKTRLLTFPS